MQILLPPPVYLMLCPLLCPQLLSKPKFSGVEKIKTIGSTYMAATGLNVTPGPDCTQASFFFCINFRTQTLTSESEWPFMANLVCFSSKNEKESFSYFHLYVGEAKKEIDMFPTTMCVGELSLASRLGLGGFSINKLFTCLLILVPTETMLFPIWHSTKKNQTNTLTGADGVFLYLQSSIQSLLWEVSYLCECTRDYIKMDTVINQIFRNPADLVGGEERGW